MPDRELPSAFTRRRFLQAAVALGGAAVLADVPGFDDVAEALASPKARSTPGGVLVVVELRGGNDALNTLVPYSSGRYRDLRSDVAVDAAAVLPLDASAGLHPSLRQLHARWRQGKVALVEGVGAAAPDLSHFASMAQWMSASDAASPATGWLGRFLDGLGPERRLFDAVTIGPDIPLLVNGRTGVATAVTPAAGLFGTSADDNDRRLYRALRDFARGTNSRGALADALAAIGRDVLDVAAVASPLRAAAPPQAAPSRDLTFAARMLNARVGIRVMHVLIPGFDTHASQAGSHAELLRTLDDGVEQFFSTLEPALAGSVAMLVVSEFGRTATANDSGGTDHGTAGLAIVVGERANGGRHGEAPSLVALGEWGRLRATTDQRAVFATVLARWLGADDREVLGASYEHLDLFASTPDAVADATDSGPTQAGRLVAVTPQRVLDTRVGTGGQRGAVGPGQTIDVALGEPAGPLPGAATSAILNLTITAATAAAFATLWPAGERRPLASNLNVTPGRTVPNLAVVKIGEAGRVSLYNSAGSAHFVADLVGYAGDVAGSTLVPIAPFRLLDTRQTDHAMVAGQPVTVKIAGVGGLPAAGVTAVVCNATIVEATTDAYVTVWPAGEPRPLASNVNVATGGTVPNLVLAKLGAGAVSVELSAGGAHLVLDVVGFLTGATSGSELHALTPARLIDTRDATGGGRPLGAAGALDLAVAGAAGVPTHAAGVVVNVTATDATEKTFVTLWPAGGVRPTTSTLNVVPGITTANLAVTLLGDQGRVSFYNAFGAAHLVVDAVGWLG